MVCAGRGRDHQQGVWWCGDDRVFAVECSSSKVKEERSEVAKSRQVTKEQGHKARQKETHPQLTDDRIAGFFGVTPDLRAPFAWPLVKSLTLFTSFTSNSSQTLESYVTSANERAARNRWQETLAITEVYAKSW